MHSFLGRTVAALTGVLLFAGSSDAGPRRGALKIVVPRFHFNIDAKARIRDLLPVPPKAQTWPVYPDKLGVVPEAAFEEMPAIPAPGHAQNAAQDKPRDPAVDSEFKNMGRIAHTIVKINHLNKERPDYFMHVLIERRPDLTGLPFVMGDACRLKPERNRPFTTAVNEVQRALSSREERSGRGTADPPSAAAFWQTYDGVCANENARAEKCDPKLMKVSRIAALTQMLGPQSREMRAGLVKYLAGYSGDAGLLSDNTEATHALAKLAIYSPEDTVRLPAVEALRNRKREDYTPILVAGLRYPWPAVAERAADAIAKLKRADLANQLVDVLDQPDPRDPVTTDTGAQTTTTVRHLVRINHHRNCLLCHAPGNTKDVPPDALTAAAAIPGEPMQSFGRYGSSPDILVRADATYLRQDFSEMQYVPNAHPWPDMQRFDFLVRTRTLTEQETASYREAIAQRGADYVSPYHAATTNALRTLTGRNAAPTAGAWRRLLATSER